MLPYQLQIGNRRFLFCFEDLIKSFIQNPILNPLIGDLQSVIISDEEAKRRKIKKNLLERQKGTVFKMASTELLQNAFTHSKLQH